MMHIERVWLRTMILMAIIGVAGFARQCAHAEPTPLRCLIKPKGQQAEGQQQGQDQQQMQAPQAPQAPQMPQSQDQSQDQEDQQEAQINGPKLPEPQQQQGIQQYFQMPQTGLQQMQQIQLQMQLQQQQKKLQDANQKKQDDDESDTYSIDLDKKTLSWGGYSFPARITDTLILVNGKSRKNEDHELVEFKGWLDRISGSMAMSESFELHDNTGRKFTSSHVFLGKCTVTKSIF